MSKFSDYLKNLSGDILKDLIFSKVGKLTKPLGEKALGNEVAMKLAQMTHNGQLAGIWFHVPNESIAHKPSDMGQLFTKRALGMIPGVPDLIFLGEDKCLQIELKTYQGKLSKSQELWKTYSEMNNVPYEIARSVSEIEEILIKHGFKNTH